MSKLPNPTTEATELTPLTEHTEPEVPKDHRSCWTVEREPTVETIDNYSCHYYTVKERRRELLLPKHRGCCQETPKPLELQRSTTTRNDCKVLIERTRSVRAQSFLGTEASVLHQR